MTTGDTALPFDAVILAGGASRRMGADKAMLDVGGRPMLEHVIDAVAEAARVVVVGPARATARDVRWRREDPVGGGPAAAVQAGLSGVDEELVVVLAADHPFVDGDVVRRLRSSLRAGDAGAVAVDASGQPQWLCSAWRTAALRRLRLGPGESLRATLGALPWCDVTLDPRATFDCDTPDDLRRARELHRERARGVDPHPVAGARARRG